MQMLLFPPVRMTKTIRLPSGETFGSMASPDLKGISLRDVTEKVTGTTETNAGIELSDDGSEGSSGAAPTGRSGMAWAEPIVRKTGAVIARTRAKCIDRRPNLFRFILPLVLMGLRPFARRVSPCVIVQFTLTCPLPSKGEGL
jgi:hypothetical protein